MNRRSQVKEKNPAVNTIIPFTDEEKKIHSLLLSANFLENLGITNGKIGIALYFFSLYRQTRNSMYEDFAFELLEEVDGAINERTLVGFRFGLCGIGWGIEYLVRERFIGVDEDICARFEHRILQYVLYDQYRGIGIADGLCGVLLYWVARIESSLVRPDSELMFANKRSVVYALDKLSALITPEKVAEIVKEQDNGMFPGVPPLVLSNWDYPALLWVLGRIWLHGILRQKAEELLERLLIPLREEKALPEKENNRKLLQKVLESLLMQEGAGYLKTVGDILPRLQEGQPAEQAGCAGNVTDISKEFLHFTAEQCLAVPGNNN